MSTPEQLGHLLNRYVNKMLTPDERAELMELVLNPDHSDAIKKIMDEQWDSLQQEQGPTDEQAIRLLQQIMAQQPYAAPVVPLKTTNRFIWRAVAAAVIVVLITGISYYYFRQKAGTGTEITNIQKHPYNNDVMPGGNKATLTLDDGTTIILSDAKNGRLADQGNTTILKVEDGQLAYTASYGEAKEVSYNTIVTQRGGQYKVVLPDGSKVWLNAASSLRFPTALTGKDRRVELGGEAYFEIEKNAEKPFYVMVEGTEVRVLGTHFNVMGYSEDSVVTTTLLEGSVKVSHAASDNNSKLLQPGQQALTGRNGNTQVQDNADIEQATAWKNGKLFFDNETLYHIMQQAARWYDVEVSYQGNVNDRYTVNISRNVPLSELLMYLEMSGGVHFDVDGKKVTVRP